MKRKRLKAARIFSFITTLFVLILLLLSGPVQAFSLETALQDTKLNIGEKTTITLKLNIEPGERLPVEILSLELIGEDSINCRFYANASAKDGCDNIDIIKLNDAYYTEGNLTGNYSSVYNWGYGDGYENGSLSYNLTINTSGLKDGVYKTKFKAKIGNDFFSKDGGNITLLNKIGIINIPQSFCVFENENIEVNANITGSVKEVWVEINGTNKTAEKTGEIYSAVINGNGSVEYRFAAEDIAGDISYGEWKEVYFNKRTKIIINPVFPNGANGWYITPPRFILENTNASEIYYEWDGSGVFVYTGEFGMENAPNNQNITGGIAELKYWSNVSCGEEEKQNMIFKADFTNPVIKDLNPADNSVVYNNLRPEISAYIDEVYQSNSGVDKNKLIMKLDGGGVNKNINMKGLDAMAYFEPDYDLSLGEHNATVNATDKAGKNSVLTWEFYINLTEMFNITVYSPLDGLYNNKKAIFKIETTEKIKMSYINWNEKNPRWSILCSNCEEYGVTRKKTRNLKEGVNNITIRGEDEFGRINEKNISVFIDSVNPKIHKTLPKKNKNTNGSLFLIEYTEENLKGIILFYDGKNKTLNCSSGKNQECSTILNLSSYDGKWVEYSFKIEDIAGNKDTEEKRIKIDTSIPVLKINLPEEKDYTAKVPFNITISEKTSLEYYDKDEARPRWRSLCSNCEEYGASKAKTKNFKKGIHRLIFKAEDEAGNSDSEEIEIFAG